jgi:1,2-diacylglycerol 3-alpha-glucosyltransferase
LVVGHVGRLASEKNLDFLARAAGFFLAKRPDAWLVVVGSGDHEDAMKETVCHLASGDRMIMAGQQTGGDLASAYAAMDVFAFSSQSETQGMVLVEAMAARTPVVALDGSGVRDVLDNSSGRLLPADATEEAFAAALEEITLNRQALRKLGEEARRLVREYSLDVCADRVLELYERLVEQSAHREDADPGPWDRLLARLEIEWNLLIEKTSALTAAVVETEATRNQLD